MKKKNRHHLLPRSRGGNNHPKNILPWQMGKHDSFHHLNGNKIITERFWEDVQKDWHVLTDEFKLAIWNVINMPTQKIYKKEAFKNLNYFNNLKSSFKEVIPKEDLNKEKKITETELEKIIGKICGVGRLEKLAKSDNYSKEKLEEITKLVIEIEKQTTHKIGEIINKIKTIRSSKTLRKKRHNRLKIIELELKKTYLKTSS